MRYVIEDTDHCQDLSFHDSLAEAVDALKALAEVPWGAEPNVAPCITGSTCSRAYEIVVCDDSVMPWHVVERLAGFTISAAGVVWSPLAPIGGA